MFTTSSIIDNLNHSEGLEYKKLCRSSYKWWCFRKTWGIRIWNWKT